MSWWTLRGTRRKASSTASGSGMTSRKSPPMAQRTPSLPSRARSRASGVVRPGRSGTGKPQSSASLRAFSGFTGSPPGKAVS